MRKPKIVKMPLAVPTDIRQWLEARAALNLQSMNSVIVATVREKMEAVERQERARERQERAEV
jgi:hypothetical protein